MHASWRRRLKQICASLPATSDTAIRPNSRPRPWVAGWPGGGPGGVLDARGGRGRGGCAVWRSREGPNGLGGSSRRVTGLRKRVTWLPERKSISQRGRQNAPPRSGETGGKGGRAGRRGRQSAGADGRFGTQPAQTEGTQPAPELGQAGRTSAGASASANTSEVAGGLHAGHTNGAHANVRTDR
jgi:hypothetical protein